MGNPSQIVLVLGIARSGTSAVSRALSAAGVDFGCHLKPKDWQNPHGNFEDFPISRINQKLLAAFGSTWSATKELPGNWQSLEPLKSAAEELKDVIQSRLQSPGLYGIKDPRLVPLFPIYRQILTELGLKFHCILVRRHQSEVLSSIQASGYFHGNYTEDRGRQLYAFYTTQLDRIQTQVDAQCFSYNDIIAQPDVEIHRLCSTLSFESFGQIANIDLAQKSIDLALYRQKL